MNVSPEEMLGWSIDDIQAQIHVMLPEGWRFNQTYSPEQMCWVATITEAAEADAEPGVWEDHHADQRISLFNAFGYLWMARQEQFEGSPWVRKRGRLTQELVTRHVQERFPDPEDLDPKEVAAVYSTAHAKKT